MGQNPSDIPKLKTLPQELQPINESCNLFLNVRNSRVYIKNDVKVGTIQDIEYELYIYKFRRLNDNFVVSVDYCSMDTPQDTCSAYSTLDYYIEKQEYTLFDKQQINQQQGIKIIQHILKAFGILYKQFGYFTPSSQMISFNHLHHPKAWIHEDPKITKNIQQPTCPQNIHLQNKFVREIVKLFDALRDPNFPMFRYSDCLPNNLLTFQKVYQIFIRKEVEVDSLKKRVLSPFHQIQNIKRHYSPPIPVLISKPVISTMTSPLNSPRMTTPIPTPQGRQTMKIPKMKIVYCSPPKKEQQEQQVCFRDSVKVSLKKTSSNSCLYHLVKPSRDFSSTMPTSLRNSRMEEKQVFDEVLSPDPSRNRIMSPNNDQNISLKKRTTQRFSEMEPTSFRRNSYKRFQLQKNNHPSFIEQSKVKIEDTPSDDQTNQKHMIKVPKAGISANSEQLAFRKDYQTHKRHKTDCKLLQKKSSDIESTFNQQSAVEPTIIQRFNCNTIKSIHLLEEDKEMDSQIIKELKQIINRYKQLH